MCSARTSLVGSNAIRECLQPSLQRWRCARERRSRCRRTRRYAAQLRCSSAIAQSGRVSLPVNRAFACRREKAPTSRQLKSNRGPDKASELFQRINSSRSDYRWGRLGRLLLQQELPRWSTPRHFSLAATTRRAEPEHRSSQSGSDGRCACLTIGWIIATRICL